MIRIYFWNSRILNVRNLSSIVVNDTIFTILWEEELFFYKFFDFNFLMEYSFPILSHVLFSVDYQWFLINFGLNLLHTDSLRRAAASLKKKCPLYRYFWKNPRWWTTKAWGWYRIRQTYMVHFLGFETNYKPR